MSLFVCTDVCFSAQSNNTDRIIDAVKQNDLKQLNSCIRSGISPNVKDVNGNAILLTAINMGYSDIAEVLIKSGANVNVCYNMGMNSLMLAINKNMEKVAALLIDYGVDVNAKLPNGMTALMIASEKGMLNIVKKNGKK